MCRIVSILSLSGIRMSVMTSAGCFVCRSSRPTLPISASSTVCLAFVWMRRPQTESAITDLQNLAYITRQTAPDDRVGHLEPMPSSPVALMNRDRHSLAPRPMPSTRMTGHGRSVKLLPTAGKRKRPTGDDGAESRACLGEGPRERVHTHGLAFAAKSSEPEKARNERAGTPTGFPWAAPAP